MSLTLGEKLRQAREERGISIREVAEQTRISPLYIESIENDNYKPLPGGIFNKGFIKSYARYIGFDENEALQDYSRLVADAEGTPDEELRPYRPEVLTDERAGANGMTPTIIFAGIILALMTGGVLFLVNYFQNQPDNAPAASNTSANLNSNANVAVNPVPTPVNTGGAPSMETLRVEFRSSGDPISLSSVSDGKTSVGLITPAQPAVFEPRQSLRLSWAKSLAQFAQLTINGKSISLPSSPANPKRVPIEVEINKDNLSGIWQSGAISFGGPPPVAEAVRTPAPSATPASTPRSAVATPVPRPAANTATATPRPARTPIVVGNAPRTRSTPD